MILGLSSLARLWPLSVPLNSLRLCSKPATASQHTNTAACTLQEQASREQTNRAAGAGPLGATWPRGPGQRPAPADSKQHCSRGGRPGRGIYRRAASPGRQVAARGTPLMSRWEAGGGSAGRRGGGEQRSGRRRSRVSSLDSLSYGLFVGSIEDLFPRAHIRPWIAAASGSPRAERWDKRW